MTMALLNLPPIPTAEEMELERVLALPRRSILNCEGTRTNGVRQWAPEAQRLIAKVTAKYTRGPRISCGCRDREVFVSPGGDLTIFQEEPPNKPPSPPIFTTREDFAQDSAHDPEIADRVLSVRAGEKVLLKGMGRPCIKSFNPVQAWMLDELARTRGAFGFMPIGSGKSLASILAPMAVSDIEGPVVLLARSDQRIHYVANYLLAREHWRVPSLVMDKVEGRGSWIVDGNVPVLHFIAYSILQQKKNTKILEERDPGMIIADEAHKLAAAASARRGSGSASAGRFLNYAIKRCKEGRSIVFCCWSGSLVNKSILDMTHLAAHALGLGSPYPISQKVAEQWSNAMDPSRMPDRTSSVARALRKAFVGGVEPEVEDLPFLMNDEDGDKEMCQGLRDHVVRTPGVISALSASVNCSIVIKERVPPKMPAEVKAALDMVREGTRPDGDIIEEEARVVAIAKNVAVGVYPYWAFPHMRCACPHGRIPRCEGCYKIDDWFEKRKAYFRKRREKLRFSETHLDSPSNCDDAAARALLAPRYDGDLPVWPCDEWAPWLAIKDKVPHDARTRWIGQASKTSPAILDADGFLVGEWLARDAAKWATENCGIVWTETVAFGERVAKIAGINYHGGGKDAEAKIHAETGKQSAVVSISSHSEGRDLLQYKWCKQLVTETPASGKGWDQLLGRLAREGQPHDEIETWVYLHTTELLKAFREAIALAGWDEDSAPTKSLFRSSDIDIPRLGLDYV